MKNLEQVPSQEERKEKGNSSVDETKKTRSIKVEIQKGEARRRRAGTSTNQVVPFGFRIGPRSFPLIRFQLRWKRINLNIAIKIPF